MIRIEKNTILFKICVYYLLQIYLRLFTGSFTHVTSIETWLFSEIQYFLAYNEILSVVEKTYETAYFGRIYLSVWVGIEIGYYINK